MCFAIKINVCSLMHKYELCLFSYIVVKCLDKMRRLRVGDINTQSEILFPVQKHDICTM